MAKAISCMVCGNSVPVPRGLLIHGFLLCRACEDRIKNISPGDPDYGFYMNGLKKIWCSRGA